MSTSHHSDKNSDKLSDTWAMISCHNESKIISSRSSTPPNSLSSSMQKWLLEAQQEFGSPVSHGSQGSAIDRVYSRNSLSEYHPQPTDVSQGNNFQEPVIINPEWVQDWSSRPEIPSPSSVATWQAKMKHYELQKRKMYDDLEMEGRRKGRAKNGLVLLLVSHACSFIIGATIAFLYLKRCHSSSISSNV